MTQDPPFDRAGAKAAGYTDAEIDAYLAQQRPSVRVAAESSSMQGPGKAPKRAAADLATAKGALRSTAQGATLGFADEIEAGARSLVGPRAYGDVAKEIRDENAQFRADNPKLAIGTEVLGGLLLGGGAGAAVKSAPRVASLLTNPTASVGRRLLTTVGGGTVAGGVQGLGKSDGEDMLGNAVRGASVGGVTAGLLGGAGELFRAGRNSAASLLRGEATSGPRAAIARAVEAESPVQAGARRVARRIGRGGNTLDDVAATEATAAPTLSLAEVVDDAAKPSAWRKNQGTQGLRIGRNMGRERDAIDESLQARAADAPDRFRAVVAEQQGLPEPRDAAAFKDELLTEAKATADPLLAEAAPKAVPDGALATVLQRVEKLKRQGLDLWGNAALADDAFPETITDQMTVGQLRTLRQEIDGNIAYGADAQNFNSIQRTANNRLKQLRDDIDGLIKAAGGDAQVEADATLSGALAKAESFQQGQQAMRASTPEGVAQRMGSARDAEGARLGAASDVQARLLNVPNGDGGRVANPTFSVAGSPMKDAKLSASLPDDAAREAVKAERELINREFQTRNRVSGNSTTFANASEGADEFGSMPDWGSAIASPTRATMGLLGRIGARGLSGLNADQATEMARILAAGLPNQMTRADAMSLLRRELPKITDAQRRSLLIRSGVGGLGGESATR